MLKRIKNTAISVTEPGSNIHSGKKTIVVLSGLFIQKLITKSKKANVPISAMLIKIFNKTWIQNCRFSDGVRTRKICLSFSFNRFKRMRQEDNYSLKAVKIIQEAALKSCNCAKRVPQYLYIEPERPMPYVKNIKLHTVSHGLYISCFTHITHCLG